MANGFVTIDVEGLDGAFRKLTKLQEAEKGLIPILENSYKRYQISAYKRAPIKTGRLKSTLVDDRFTTKEYGHGSYTITQRQGVYHGNGRMTGAYYLLLQEFSNPNGKARFARNSIIEEEPKLRRELFRLFERMAD